MGLLYQSAGSFLSPVQLPNGATVTSFRYILRDFSDVNTYAYLIRKRIQAGKSAFLGYTVMASTHSTGFDDLIREFTDNTINSPLVDTSLYAYFVELITCDSSMEPIAVKVVFTA